ncbi:hypothetical protein Taro_055917 [Colocasia esculenta]|uniref:Uncharacterized protein n=1 Tax=Colocasia esculenta TaxID=4460 RepID=A0A843XS60_COLES|nr:hypothetical protein [Colocasia esculenta]
MHASKRVFANSSEPAPVSTTWPPTPPLVSVVAACGQVLQRHQMAAGVGIATVVLVVGWLLHLITVNNGPGPLVGDSRNPSEIAVYSAFTAFLVYNAGIVILFFEVQLEHAWAKKLPAETLSTLAGEGERTTLELVKFLPRLETALQGRPSWCLCSALGGATLQLQRHSKESVRRWRRCAEGSGGSGRTMLGAQRRDKLDSFNSSIVLPSIYTSTMAPKEDKASGRTSYS